MRQALGGQVAEELRIYDGYFCVNLTVLRDVQTAGNRLFLGVSVRVKR